MKGRVGLFRESEMGVSSSFVSVDRGGRSYSIAWRCRGGVMMFIENSHQTGGGGVGKKPTYSAEKI